MLHLTLSLTGANDTGGRSGTRSNGSLLLTPPAHPNALEGLVNNGLKLPAAALYPSLVLLAHALPGVELPAIIHDETEVAHHVVQRPVRGQPVPNVVDAEGRRHKLAIIWEQRYVNSAHKQREIADVLGAVYLVEHRFELLFQR